MPVANIGRRGKTYVDPNVHIIKDGEKGKNEAGAADRKQNVGTGQPLSEPIFLDKDGWYIVPDSTGSNIFYTDFRPDESFDMTILWS